MLAGYTRHSVERPTSMTSLDNPVHDHLVRSTLQQTETFASFLRTSASHGHRFTHTTQDLTKILRSIPSSSNYAITASVLQLASLSDQSDTLKENKLDPSSSCIVRGTDCYVFSLLLIICIFDHRLKANINVQLA